MDTWDFIIVGGGAAGCVLANRLSEHGARVLLLEAGRDTPPGEVPDDISDLYPRSYANPAYQWPGLKARLNPRVNGGRPVPFQQTRLMGGGSNVTGMISFRGVPGDFDQWERQGATGWGWSDVLPYFNRLERDVDFDGPVHGHDGPVPIRRHFREAWPPFMRAIERAAADKGLPYVSDLNGDFRDGVGPYPLCQASERVTSASAFLDTATRQRPNLRILPETEVLKLLFEGTRCVGVSARGAGGTTEHRGGRVILAAGGIHSPAILMRSGVGPADHLRERGVAVVADLPGVGSNLQNHPVVYLATHLLPPARQPKTQRPMHMMGVRFSSGLPDCGPGDMHFMVLNKSSWHGMGQAIGAIGTILNQPHSRGSVRLDADDPMAPPEIDFRYLSDDRDRERMIGGLKLAVELMRHPAVKGLRNEIFTQGYSEVVRRLNIETTTNKVIAASLAGLLNGPTAARRFLMTKLMRVGETDEDIMLSREFLGETVDRRSFGTFHPAGTCRLGAIDDPLAVLDPSCSVRGVEGLSVADASAMPTVPRGNTNIPAMMVAERASDLIRRLNA